MRQCNFIQRYAVRYEQSEYFTLFIEHKIPNPAYPQEVFLQSTCFQINFRLAKYSKNIFAAKGTSMVTLL